MVVKGKSNSKSIIQRSWVSEKPEIKTHPHWLLNCRSASSITSSISVAIVILLLELCYHYTICIVWYGLYHDLQKTLGHGSGGTIPVLIYLHRGQVSFFTLHFSQNCALMHGNKGCPCRILASLDYAIYCKQISLKFNIRFYTPRSVKGMFQVVFIAAKHYATLHR